MVQVVTPFNGGKLKAAIASFSSQQEEKSSDMWRRCNNCFAAVSCSNVHGHVCGSKGSLLQNLKEALPLETKKQLALETLKELQRASGDGVLVLQSHKGGKPTVVTLGKPSQNTLPVLNSEDFKKMMIKGNLTEGQGAHVLGDVRSLFGRKSVAAHIRDHHIQSRKELKTFFTSELVNFLQRIPGSHDYELDPQPMVFCHALEGLITYVARKRGLSEVEVLKLVGLDRGQGHTQLTLQPHTESDLFNKQAEVAKRRRRSDGVTVKGKSVFGVNSLIILASSPVSSENSGNLNIFLAHRLENLVIFGWLITEFDHDHHYDDHDHDQNYKHSGQ